MNRLTLTLAALALAAGLEGPPAAAAQGSHDHAHGSADPAEEYLRGRLAADGLAAAMAALDSVAAADPEVRRLGHAYAHAIGIASYTGDQPVGEVFGQCTPIFQSGCYHGVIQSYFDAHRREHGDRLDPALVEGLCAAQRAAGASRWDLFQCAHGLGHGLTMVVDHHLPSALEACDLLSSDWEREVCYSAVFMENVVHATSTATAIGRPSAAPTHAHATSSTVAFPPLKADDPHYPCSVLDARYLSACYQMQTSAMLQQNGFDVRAAATACTSAPMPYRTTCFQSLGRDISGLTVQDHPKALVLCANAPVEFQPYCHLGYAKNLVDLTSVPGDGMAFCRLLPTGESKRACYIGMGEEIWVLYADAARRRLACESAEAAYRGDCERGAGVDQASMRPLSRR